MSLFASYIKVDFSSRLVSNDRIIDIIQNNFLLVVGNRHYDKLSSTSILDSVFKT